MRAPLPALAALLAAANIWIFGTVLAVGGGELRVSVLDVGQGDAILIQGPTGVQVLIDGGPDRSVLRRLGEELGPLDRSLDLVIETHPDQDHIGGLADVFAAYDVAGFMEPGIPASSSPAAALAAAWRAEGAAHIIARRGMVLDLGGGAYAQILSPDRDPARFNTNDASIVMRLTYGSTSFMLTGDLPSTIEEWLVALDDGHGNLASDVLKAGHHGSKNSTSAAWLAAVHPALVAVSAGAGNSYGHPSPDMLARVAEEGAAVYSTIERGTVTFTSDGRRVQLR